MSSPKRIAYVTNNPNLGSTARVFLDWFELGRECGIESTVLLPRQGPLKEWLDSRGFANRLSSAEPLSKKRLLGSLLGISRAFLLLRRRRIELIHCMEHNCFPFAWRLGKWLNVPTVCHVQYRLERGFTEWAFGNQHPPTAVIWTAQSQKNDSSKAVEGLLDNSLEIVLPMGVDPSRFGVRATSGMEVRESLGFTSDNVVLGIACAFRSRKRVEDFIRLISVLRSEFPEIRGVIAGGPVSDEMDYTSELHTMIDREDLKKHVLFLGDLVDIEPVHQAIDVSVSTSEYETFGMSVCEAMACGKPTIGYAGGSVREVIGMDDCIAETGDFPRLLSIARRLVGDAKMREQYGRLARRRVEQEFNPVKTFEVLMALYRQIS